MTTGEEQAMEEATVVTAVTVAMAVTAAMAVVTMDTILIAVGTTTKSSTLIFKFKDFIFVKYRIREIKLTLNSILTFLVLLIHLRL
jgi:hypothetical protein